MTVSVNQPPELKKRELTSLQRQQHNTGFGAAGERRAIKFLEKKNFQILDINVRVGAHEVDIIAIDPGRNDLVFFEVKTRQTDFFGDPSRAVGKSKLRSMQIVARTYLKQKKWTGDFRFDVIAVLPNSIEHFENVTW